MLTIICGEDNVNSRKYIQNLKSGFSSKNFEIRNIAPQQIEEMQKWFFESPSLFSEKKVFFTDNLMKYLKRTGEKLLADLEKIAAATNIEIYDWEDSLTSRDLKTIKGALVKEFKPSENIFKLLDACYPPNKKQFLQLLDSVNETLDENFIFIMLTRHIRNLILINDGAVPTRMQKWQAQKFQSLGRHWQQKKLVSFYQGLYRIEIRNKTSTNPYSVKESLEIISCYFL